MPESLLLRYYQGEDTPKLILCENNHPMLGQRAVQFIR